MKINWGTGIVISIIAFISFILCMVFQMVGDNAYNHELVTNKYYQKELKYQDNIEAIKNMQHLKEKITTKKTAEGLVIFFPLELEQSNVKGTVFLYRPSNEKLDIESTIEIKEHQILIPKERLLEGRWNMEVNFNYQNKEYLYKEQLLY